jgi:hypothetical protein
MRCSRLLSIALFASALALSMACKSAVNKFAGKWKPASDGAFSETAEWLMFKADGTFEMRLKGTDGQSLGGTYSSGEGKATIGVANYTIAIEGSQLMMQSPLTDAGKKNYFNRIE